METNQTYRAFAAFNALTITGRISNSEIVTVKGDEFLSVSVISNLMNDDEGVVVKFTNSNGLMKLFLAGGLDKGRMVTLVGHIKSVAETYTNSAGEIVLLKRPQINLIDVTIPTGGLGATPRAEGTTKRAVGAVVRPSDASPANAWSAQPTVDATPAV
jgi:hypothetical protein